MRQSFYDRNGVDVIRGEATFSGAQSITVTRLDNAALELTADVFVVATLKGHDPATKIRCLAAAMVEDEEWLVSGGFDQKLIVWKHD